MNTFNLCDNCMWKSGNVFQRESDVFVLHTVNSEIFAWVYFCETSHMYMRSFVKIKPTRKSKITLSFTDEGKT